MADPHVALSDPTGRLPGGGKSKNFSKYNTSQQEKSLSQAASKISDKDSSNASKMEGDQFQKSSQSMAGSNVLSMSESASNPDKKAPGKPTKEQTPKLSVSSMDSTQWNSTKRSELKKYNVCGVEVEPEALRRFWRYSIFVLLGGELYFACGATVYMWTVLYPHYSMTSFLLGVLYASAIIPLVLCDIAIEIGRTYGKDRRWMSPILYWLRAAKISLLLSATATVYMCCVLHDQDFISGIIHAILQLTISSLGIVFKIMEDHQAKKNRAG